MSLVHCVSDTDCVTPSYHIWLDHSLSSFDDRYITLFNQHWGALAVSTFKLTWGGLGLCWMGWLMDCVFDWLVYLTFTHFCCTGECAFCLLLALLLFYFLLSLWSCMPSYWIIYWLIACRGWVTQWCFPNPCWLGGIIIYCFKCLSISHWVDPIVTYVAQNHHWHLDCSYLLCDYFIDIVEVMFYWLIDSSWCGN
jgi:hypothetical protein